MNDTQTHHYNRLRDVCLLRMKTAGAFGKVAQLDTDQQACVQSGVSTATVASWMACHGVTARRRLQELADLGAVVRVPPGRQRSVVTWWPVGLLAKVKEHVEFQRVQALLDRRPGDEA